MKNKENFMTEEEFAKIEKELENKARKAEEAALKAFAKGPVAELEWTMNDLTEHLLERIVTIRSGEAPEAFGGFSLDTLARTLATKTYCTFRTLRVSKELALQLPAGTDFSRFTFTTTGFCWTPQFGLWRKMVTALMEYLHEAAIFAKHVNPSSTAARLYLRALMIARRLYARNSGYSEATKDEALSIINLEKVAADRLWVDAQFAALPKYKKAKGAKKPKAAKGA